MRYSFFVSTRVLLLFWSVSVFYAQTPKKSTKQTLEISNFYGTVARHNPEISHLITGNPQGIFVAWDYKTSGEKDWHKLYNRPDWGVGFLYQDMADSRLGSHIGLYAHYNFYLWKRALSLRTGTGFSYNTNPYDKVKNFRNVAYGTHLLSSTYLFLNYNQLHIWEGLGITAGLGIIHYSNGNFKAPNKSTNTVTASIGLRYDFENKSDVKDRILEKRTSGLTSYEPFRFHVWLRGGINENDLVGSGQFPFYTPGIMVSKAISRRSDLQLGSEVFFSRALREFIEFRKAGDFEDKRIKGNPDAKRVGIYIGHELKISQFSILNQIGYYAYYPVDFEGRVYLRTGLNFRWSPKVQASFTVKSHAAKAETVELSLGYAIFQTQKGKK